MVSLNLRAESGQFEAPRTNSEVVAQLYLSPLAGRATVFFVKRFAMADCP
jgi:hypothetical protein